MVLLMLILVLLFLLCLNCRAMDDGGDATIQAANESVHGRDGARPHSPRHPPGVVCTQKDQSFPDVRVGVVGAAVVAFLLARDAQVRSPAGPPR